MRRVIDFDCYKIMGALVRCILGRQPLEPVIIENFHQLADHCVLFEIYRRNGVLVCEIVAGVPEDEHKIGLIDPLEKHPDIEEAVRLKEMTIIFNPDQHPLTQYFSGIIREKNIRQIVYLPLLVKDSVVGVIVIDFCGEKSLEKEQLDYYFRELKELISKVLSSEFVRLDLDKRQHWAPEFIPRRR